MSPAGKQKSPRASSLAMGRVSLNVKSLSTMKNFYQHTLGLTVLEENKTTVTLGEGVTPLVALHEVDLNMANRAQAGLYHFALLFSSQKSLATRIQHILTTMPQHFAGSADHLVSEAFYFTDPEGNGIELYFDRARSAWQWVDGSIQMATLYIDPVSYIQQHISSEDTKGNTRMGHVHLKVGDIQKARDFYADILGFDVTAELPGALFVSVGGYHHHIGLNSWESSGAPMRTPSAGLKVFDIEFEEQESLAAISKRLVQHNIPFEQSANGFIAHDPWGNQIHLTLKSV